jgi:predicted CoA-binding protein
MTQPAIEQLLRESQVIAVVGLSSNPERPSYGIARALRQRGYRIIPVNPQESEVLGEKAYSSLLEVPEKVDIVNVFRRPAQTPEVARQAVQIGARALWLQTGISNDEAESIAHAGGLMVVMDRCIMVERIKFRW